LLRIGYVITSTHRAKAYLFVEERRLFLNNFLYSFHDIFVNVNTCAAHASMAFLTLRTNLISEASKLMPYFFEQKCVLVEKLGARMCCFPRPSRATSGATDRGEICKTNLRLLSGQIILRSKHYDATINGNGETARLWGSQPLTAFVATSRVRVSIADSILIVRRLFSIIVCDASLECDYHNATVSQAATRSARNFNPAFPNAARPRTLLQS
jgi:hypothetical protein